MTPSSFDPNDDGRPDPTLRILSGDAEATSKFSLAAAARMRVVAASHRGHIRKNNEDQYLVANVTRGLNITQSSISKQGGMKSSDSALLLGVADGVGSVPGGQVASAMALDAVAESIFHNLPWPTGKSSDAVALADSVEAALLDCQRRMGEVAARKQLDVGMASTLTVALVHWPSLLINHIGDSRAYLYRAGKLQLLTQDHTLAQDLLDAGALEQKDLINSRYSRTLSNTVGGVNTNLRLQVCHFTLQTGDLLLLSTDGLHGQVSNTEIADRLGQARSFDAIKECAHNLIADANAAGGRDNVTLILAGC